MHHDSSDNRALNKEVLHVTGTYNNNNHNRAAGTAEN